MNCKNNQNKRDSGLRRSVTTLGAMLALAFAAPAMAGTIDFESLPPAAYMSSESVNTSGYNLLFVNGPVAAEFGFESGIGTVIDSGNAMSCDIAGCPVGAAGNYLAILNDGAVKMTRGGHQFSISSLDFAFVAPVPVGPGDYGRLQLTGTLSDGSMLSTMLAFPGQNSNFQFLFGASDLDAAFRGSVFTSLTINACLWDGNGDCSNSFDSPAFNQAQFAIDNVVLNEIPEPGSIALFGLAAGALGLSRRRAARKAAKSATI
ncbi:MAG: NF038120 family PEP-CTERM protein [Pseudomonadota bacterium]